MNSVPSHLGLRMALTTWDFDCLRVVRSRTDPPSVCAGGSTASKVDQFNPELKTLERRRSMHDSMHVTSSTVSRIVTKKKPC
jgi:hypothetical protein